jgi:hypothetical protein
LIEQGDAFHRWAARPSRLAPAPVSRPDGNIDEWAAAGMGRMTRGRAGMQAREGAD